MNNKFLISAIALNLILLLNYFLWAIFPLTTHLAQALIILYIAICIYPLMNTRETWPLIAFICFGLFVTIFTGSVGWDARSIWLFHGKRIFFEGGLYAQLDNYAPWSHNDYPVLYSAFTATIARAIGGWNEILPKTASIFFLIPPLLIFLKVFSNPTRFLVFNIGLLLICREHPFNGYMDAILALYTCAAVLLLMPTVLNSLSIDTKDKNIYVALTGTFLVALPLLKNEGLIILLCISVAALLFKSSLSKKSYIFVLLMTLIFFFFTWKLPLLQANLQNDLVVSGIFDRALNRMRDINSLYLIASNFLKNIWITLTLMTVSLYVVGVKFSKIYIPAIFLILYTGFLLAVYLITPHDLKYHLWSSIDRTLMPVNLLMFCIGILIFKKHRHL